jgi:hypothetical protein
MLNLAQRVPSICVSPEPVAAVSVRGDAVEQDTLQLHGNVVGQTPRK